jgi:hypothetical protein
MSTPPVKNWRELFDLVIVSAAKPGFFRKDEPFIELDAAGTELKKVKTPQWGGIYSGGSREGLMRLTQEPGEHVAAFAATGLEVVPAPMGFTRVRNPRRSLLDVVPHPMALYESHLVLHEWVGIVWYRLRYGHRNRS